MKKYFHILYLLLVSTITLNGQESPIDIYVKQADLPVNISARSINKVFPDSKGFIWLGTSSGLYRWDGLRALKFESETVSNYFTAIGEDQSGTIWAGCKDGSISLVSNEELLIWKTADTLDYSRVTDILFDASGNLWWGTNGSGLFLFNGQKTVQIDTEYGLPDNYIYKLEKGLFNEIWASTDRGIAQCKSWEGLHEIVAFGQESGLLDDIVRVVEVDEKGNILLGFHEGGICIGEKPDMLFRKVNLSQQIAFGQINSIVVEKNGCWAADLDNGLLFTESIENPIFKKVRMHGEVIPSDIQSVCSDLMGNLWILDQEGLFVSAAGCFTKIENLHHFDLKKLNSFLTDDWETFWGVTDNLLLNITPFGTKTYLNDYFSSKLKITALREDSLGNLFIATFGQGVVVFNKESHSVKFITEKDGLINNNVLDISIKGNSIWVATLGGASHISEWTNHWFDKKTINSFDKEHGLGNNFIYNILQDDHGNVWFGTDGNGLVKYDQEVFISYDETNGLGDDVVYSIDECSNGDIWLSTATSGIYRYDGIDFIHMGKEEGLSGANSFSLIAQNNFVFILNESGLSIMDRANEQFLIINEELDLRQVQAELNSAFSANGYVGFATSEGIIKIDTKRLPNYSLRPFTIIDRVTTNLEPIQLYEEMTFGPNENRFVFEFTGHWYLAPRKVRFLTRLSGYDEDWNSTNDRRASYSSLPPGNFEFEAYAFLNDMIGIPDPIEVKFQIQKPIYIRWWFIILIVLFLAALVYWLIKYREQRLKKVEARKKEKLEFEFQTLKNQINPHFLFNSFSTLISMIEEDTAQAVDYTQSISDFLREILEVKDQELIPVYEELEMISNYYFIQKKRFGDNLSVLINLDDPTQKSLIPPLTLQLLIENAIKHNIVSRGKPLSVSISVDGADIKVLNNKQPKKNVEHSTGIGLKNIIDRYKILAGKNVNIEETENEFKVLLPIIQSKKQD